MTIIAIGKGNKNFTPILSTPITSSFFINDNINLIRKDIDILVPSISKIKNISYQFAKDSILKMNNSFAQRFSSASKSLLVLTAPDMPKDNIDKSLDTGIEKLTDITFDNLSDPKDFVKENTKEISLGIENETVTALLNQVEESEVNKDSNFEIFDLVFISLISLASGALLALIFIQLRKIKISKEQEYDFEEAKDDNSMFSVLPKGLSIENNQDQQQLDLATTYYEMNDKDNAKKILSNLAKKSDNDEIKKRVNDLLSKLNKL